MGYKIYYANSATSSGSGGFGTGGRFQQYDRKTYPTKEAAQRQLAKERKKYAHIERQTRRQGIRESYQIRSIGGNRLPSQPRVRPFVI